MTITSIVAVLVAANLAGPARPQGPTGPDLTIQGLAGHLHIVSGDREGSDMVQRLEVAVGDRIQLNYSYPLLFDSVPASVSGRSDDQAVVKYLEARTVTSYPAVRGANTLAGTFVAEQPGEATIVFVVRDTKDGAGIGGQVRCSVTVAGPEGR